MLIRLLKYIVFTLLIFLSIAGNSQERKLKKADAFYEAGEYFESIDYYKRVVEKLTGRREKAPLYYKIGNAYYLAGDYRKARTYLSRAAKYDESIKDAFLKEAEILRMSEKFDEALLIYQEFLQIYPNDTLVPLLIESIELTKLWMSQPTRYKLSPVKDFNTRENDFSPFVVEKDGFDHVFFSSNRKGVTGNQKSGITGLRFNDIFVSKMNRQAEWSEPERIDSLNSEYDEGTPFLSDAGSLMYFTSCQAEKGKPLGCQIYKISKNGNEWLNPERVDIVGDSISIGHPCFSPDGSRLYFAARMDGGFGGSDIWYVENEDGGWSRPKNLGLSINTKYDELFPFVKADSTLYFASDRLPSMGGLDLYQAIPDGKYRYIVENMKHPFSSPGNDFGIYYYANEDKGFLTSDREGSKGEDIYFFEKPPLKFALEGFVKDKDTEEVIDSAIIRIIGSDGTVFTDTSDVHEGFFSFSLKPKTDYVFVVQKEGYFNGKARLTTDSLMFDHTFQYQVFLESYDKTFEIPNIEFEFGSKELTQAAKHSLDSIAGVLQNNPNIVVELAAHTDMIGSDENNMVLSNERAEAVKQYLISKGILQGRMTTVGYGESKPIEILENHPTHQWLNRGNVLTPEFVEKLTPEQQEIANQLNRRTELRVIAHDFVPSLD
jgi:peptidoglycan-associated lipoprotein